MATAVSWAGQQPRWMKTLTEQISEGKGNVYVLAVVPDKCIPMRIHNLQLFFWGYESFWTQFGVVQIQVTQPKATRPHSTLLIIPIKYTSSNDKSFSFLFWLIKWTSYQFESLVFLDFLSCKCWLLRLKSAKKPCLLWPHVVNFRLFGSLDMHFSSRTIFLICCTRLLV